MLFFDAVPSLRPSQQEILGVTGRPRVWATVQRDAPWRTSRPPGATEEDAGRGVETGKFLRSQHHGLFAHTASDRAYSSFCKVSARRFYASLAHDKTLVHRDEPSSKN